MEGFPRLVENHWKSLEKQITPCFGESYRILKHWAFQLMSERQAELQSVHPYQLLLLQQWMVSLLLLFLHSMVAAGRHGWFVNCWAIKPRSSTEWTPVLKKIRHKQFTTSPDSWFAYWMPISCQVLAARLLQVLAPIGTFHWALHGYFPALRWMRVPSAGRIQVGDGFFVITTNKPTTHTHIYN